METNHSQLPVNKTEKTNLMYQMESELSRMAGSVAVASEDLDLIVYVQTMMGIMKPSLEMDEYIGELEHLGEFVALDKEDRYKLVDFEEFHKIRKETEKWYA